MKNKIISIIIPVYNSERYIKRCLESLMKNSIKDNIEVIVVNDCSQDNTLDILLEEKKYIKNLKIINNPKNLGVSVSRNIAIKEAKGEYILMIDADDCISENLINILINEIMVSKCDIYRYRAKVINDKSGKDINRFNIEYKYNQIISGLEAIVNWSCSFKQYSVPWIYCIKKILYNDIKFLENTVHEDFGAIPLLIIKAKTIKNLDYLGYFYIKNSEGITSLYDEKKEMKKSMDYLKQYDYLINNLELMYKNKEISYTIRNFLKRDIKLRMPEKLRYLKNKKNLFKYRIELFKRGIFRKKGIT